MKFCVSTDVGTWSHGRTGQLLSLIRIIVRTQEPDLHLDFGILAGYLEKLWTDFDEILWVDSGGGLDELVRFSAGSGL